MPPATTPLIVEAPVSSDGEGQHRRRRRRRRGRGGKGGGTPPGISPMPDRQIFEVAPDGAAHATGSSGAARTGAFDCEGERRLLRRPSKRRRQASQHPSRSSRRPSRRAAAECLAARLLPRSKTAASAVALPVTETKKPRRTRKSAPAAEAVEPASAALPPKPARKRKTAGTAASRKKS